jgi:hypothetical protein
MEEDADLPRSVSIDGRGFVAGTLIVTPKGLCPIELTKPADKAFTYDFNNKCPIEDCVVDIVRRKSNEVVEIETENSTIIVHPQHRFFTETKDWVQAKELLKTDILRTRLHGSKIIRTALIKKDVELYCLAMKNNHNYFVSRDGVLVHNVLPAIIVAAATGIQSAAAAVYAYIAANFTASVGVSFFGIGAAVVMGGGRNNNRMDMHADNAPNIAEKKITNKEADANAAKVGAVRVKIDNPPKGLPVYKTPDGRLISPDIDGHKGGTWKEIGKDSERKATLDENLKVIGK